MAVLILSPSLLAPISSPPPPRIGSGGTARPVTWLAFRRSRYTDGGVPTVHVGTEEQRVISVAEALERVLAGVAVLEAESVPLGEALGRVLAEPVVSAREIPPWANSSMDGYAVRAADTESASREQPVTLAVVGEVAAGRVAAREVGSGQAYRILTGAPLPPGSDAVVPQEEVTPRRHPPGDPAGRPAGRVRAAPWRGHPDRGPDPRDRLGSPAGRARGAGGAGSGASERLPAPDRRHPLHGRRAGRARTHRSGPARSRTRTRTRSRAWPWRPEPFP